MIARVKKIWWDWWDIPETKPGFYQSMTYLKANQLHVFMLLLVFILCMFYTFLGFALNTPGEAFATALPLPVVAFNYFVLYKNGFNLASKLLAILLILGVISVLTMMNGVSNGELVFMIPLMVGTQIVFQGPERKYAFFLNALAISVTIYLIVTERRIILLHPYQHKETRIEHLLNYVGAALATIIQIGFLILINNRLQERSIGAAKKLHFINNALSSAIKNNERQTKQITKQLEELRKADLELHKLSQIAKMTVNGVVITDGEGKIEWVNNSFERITGYTLEEVKGFKLGEFLQGEGADMISKMISEKLHANEFVETTILNYTKDKKPYYNQIQITPVFNEEGKLNHFIALQRDITTEVNYLNEIERLKNNYEQVVAEVTNDFIWEWDLKGEKIVLGRNLDDIFDPMPNGSPGQYIWKLESLHPEDQQKLIEIQKNSVPTPSSKWLMEYRYLDKKGTYRIFLDRAFIRFDGNEKPLNVIGAISDVTKQRQVEAELVEQKIKEQKLIATIAMQSQEKEKNKIATELHDNINQLLVASKMYLDLYNSEHNTPDRFLQKSQDGIEKALQEIRKISHSLAAPFAHDYDLMDAIGELISEHKNEESIDVRINDQLPKNLEISEETKLVIYRIVQEQVQNVYLHSGAKTMDIGFFIKDNSINFSIEDDGKGFNEKDLHSGLGLKTISSRVTIHGGTMNLSSNPGQGCRLDISLPLVKN